MNLSQLEVLVAIVDAGNMTEAAEGIGLTQSAVSYSVSRLEAELGVKLLERGRHGVHATRVDEEVIQHARSVLNQNEFYLGNFWWSPLREKGLEASPH